MPTIFIGLLALALVLWLAKSFTRVDPKYMIRVGRTVGGIVALAGAAFLGASLGSACWLGAGGVVRPSALATSAPSPPGSPSPSRNAHGPRPNAAPGAFIMEAA